MKPATFTPKRSRCFLHVFALLLFFSVAADIASAQISPGKLSAAHEPLEGITKCTQCHELGQAVVGAKCLTCHTFLKSRIDAGKGYHASTDADGEACTTCHSEHHGRDHELIYWPSGQSEFDHALTGWTFSGAHQELDCRECHLPRFHVADAFPPENVVNEESTFLGLDQQCVSCHEDEHADQLTNTCTTCHNQQAWKPASGFDHTRDTDYALTGRHTELECVKCHVTLPRESHAAGVIVDTTSPDSYAEYAGLTFASCADCHEDVHKGRFGTDCSRCHTTGGFQSATASGEFDHSKTAFPLMGQHLQVECLSCHTSGSMTEPLAHEQCNDCHEDEHRGQFASREDGGACDACHSVERPFRRTTFGLSEHEQTDFALTGSHRAIPCALCHVQEMDDAGDSYATFTFNNTRCQACHDDIHRGQLDIWIDKNGCEFCHNTATWNRTSFDHNLARFPLQGKHREILCLKCHWIETDAGEELVWMKPLERTCAGCHDDPHAGQFAEIVASKGCEQCHIPSRWSDLLFVHNRDTNFPLTGGHEGVACNLCHKPMQPGEAEVIQYAGLSRECSACHGNQPERPGRDG
ncbi:hypothetical protein KQI52_06785 [bacterium]|nr:hypothetical protein [bacterium]